MYAHYDLTYSIQKIKIINYKGRGESFFSFGLNYLHDLLILYLLAEVEFHVETLHTWYHVNTRMPSSLMFFKKK